MLLSLYLQHVRLFGRKSERSLAEPRRGGLKGAVVNRNSRVQWCSRAARLGQRGGSVRARVTRRLRKQVHLLPMLILNPLRYVSSNINAPRAIARMVRIRCKRRCRFDCRGDREGGSLLRRAAEAEDQVPRGGPHRQPSGKIGPLQSTYIKSVSLGESPSC